VQIARKITIALLLLALPCEIIHAQTTVAADDSAENDVSARHVRQHAALHTQHEGHWRIRAR
jgi:hypothetical protein